MNENKNTNIQNTPKPFLFSFFSLSLSLLEWRCMFACVYPQETNASYTVSKRDNRMKTTLLFFFFLFCFTFFFFRFVHNSMWWKMLLSFLFHYLHYVIFYWCIDFILLFLVYFPLLLFSIFFQITEIMEEFQDNKPKPCYQSHLFVIFSFERARDLLGSFPWPWSIYMYILLNSFLLFYIDFILFFSFWMIFFFFLLLHFWLYQNWQPI